MEHGGVKMKRLVIELDEALHKKIKTAAFEGEKTMKSYVLDIIEREMDEKEKKDAEHSDF